MLLQAYCEAGFVVLLFGRVVFMSLDMLVKKVTSQTKQKKKTVFRFTGGGTLTKQVKICKSYERRRREYKKFEQIVQICSEYAGF